MRPHAGGEVAHVEPLDRPSPRLAATKALIAMRLDRFDVLLLAVLTALSLWTLGLDLWQVIAFGRVWTGTEAVYEADGMQSMMWIVGILHHGASPDLYVLGRSSADFFQPLVAISAGVAALGVAPYVALLLWKPIALIAIFFAVRAYVHGAIDGVRARRAALALALFFGWGQVIGDSWIVFWSWGYPFALIGLACAVGALLAYSRDRAAGRIGPFAPLLALLASWLHPWQGETLILVLLGAELALLLRGERGHVTQLALTLVCAVLPLCYFTLLVHFDPVWQREHEAALSTYPISRVVYCFVPLLLPSLLAYRLRARGFIVVTTRVWPLATVGVFVFSEWQGSGSTHALLGATVPLGVLAVEGVRSLPWSAMSRWLSRSARRLHFSAAAQASPPLIAVLAIAVLAIAVLTVPGTIYMLQYAQKAVRPHKGNANFITPSENEALAYLAHDPQPGGVLTRFYLGMVVPAHTARKTYVGDCYWSEPDCDGRSRITVELLAGELAPARARELVQHSGARFVLGDCHSHDLTTTLSPILSSVHRFGCATVYVIR